MRLRAHAVTISLLAALLLLAAQPATALAGEAPRPYSGEEAAGPPASGTVGPVILAWPPATAAGAGFRVDLPDLGQALAQERFALQARQARPGASGILQAGQAAAPQGGQEGQQQEQEAQDPAQGNGALRVFLDCNTFGGGPGRGRGPCRDLDFLRREITFINYVRDREDSDVHVLVTQEFAGASILYHLDFIGQRDFEGDDVAFEYSASNTNTDDETREGFAQTLRVGLLHYVAKTPLIDRIEIDLGDAPEAAVQEPLAMATAEEDPWNFWVFRINLRGRFEGEDRRSNRNVNLDLSANRTTEAWKVRLSSDFRYDERTFELSDGSEVLSFTRNYGLTGQVVKSFGDHWGASLKAAALHATFVNQSLTTILAPGVEYNFFPYSESSRRQLTFTYEIGAGNYQYDEVTIFDETEELLFDHVFLANYDVNQPWGNVDLGLETAQFFNELGQWRVVLNGRVDFRITRGLSVNLNGEWSTIRDQRFLPLEELSDEEVLLERQQLATNSRYEISFGVTYQFGSIFNNVVNPRFAGSRGGFSRFF